MSEQNTDKFIDNILALVQAIITLFALPFMVLTRYGMGASVVGWLNALGATFLISMYSYGWGGAPLRSLATLVFLLCMAHFYIAMRLKHYGKHIHTKHIGFIYGQRTIASMVDQRLKRLPGQRSFELAVFREVITHSGLIMYCVFYTIIIFLEARVDRYEYIQAEPTLGTVLFGTARLGQESLRVETGA